MSAPSPSVRFRRALIEAAEALADLFDDEADGRAPLSADATPPTEIPNNAVAERFARDQLAQRGWPAPAKRRRAG